MRQNLHVTDDGKISRRSSGFSMIEVLVASTILVMIVMMLGMLFQQTSQAWRTGRQRADVYLQVRALFGAVQRDASAAVDEKTIPVELRTLGAQAFSGSLKFYTLTGTGYKGDADPQGGTPRRSLTFVTYDGSGRRTETWAGDESRSTPIIGSSVDKAKVGSITYTASRLGPNGTPASGSEFPAVITLSASVEAAGKSLDIGAASGGPDGILGSSPDVPQAKDDIKTWADGAGGGGNT